ncbi:MAG: metallophosphoesterase [Syntrophomonas sp.]|nr:metallophosphoesterase [Syntrophomonas sp.]
MNLSGLIPGTSYRYRIGQNGKLYSFRTSPRRVVPFSFVIYGDYSSGGNRRIKLRLYRRIPKEHPGFILFTGDLVPNGNNLGIWKNQFFAPVGGLSPYFPLVPTHGNHDGAGSLFNYYFRSPGRRRWDSFVYANAHFILLDTESNYSPGSPQYRFLVRTLQRSRAGWKLVCLHQPPYSTNRGHHSNLKVRAVLCPIFEKYGVNIVFSGHNHCYERTQPIYQNRVNLKSGVTYIATGGGGAALHPPVARNNLSAAEKKWISVRLKIHHYLSVRITGKKLIVTAKNSNGKIIDRLVKTRL